MCARYGPCEAAALQERMKRAVALLGEDEVRTILETEGRIEARHLKQALTVWRLVPLLVLGQGMGWVLHFLADSMVAQVTCEFCKETYQFQEEEVLAAAPSA